MNNTDNNQTILVLFYHEQSIACQKLKEYIPKDIKNLNLVDISKTYNIPTEITSIPALLINNKDLLIGKGVFDFFNKKDDIDFLNLCSKNSGCSFSTIDDNDNISSNGLYSTIDMPSISNGVPQWNDEKQDKLIDIDRFMADRDKAMPSTGKNK